MASVPSETQFHEFLAEQARWLAGKNLPPSLYHYTSALGIRAIISSGVLRAFNLGQMNDFAEGRYAASVMRAHIDRGYAVEPNPNASALLLAMRQQLTGINLTNVFALSFMRDGDEMGMWRLYADRGKGFSFAIRIAEALSWATSGHLGFLLKVSYDPKVLDEFCIRALTKIRVLYLADVAAALAPDPAHYANLFLENVAWFAPAFKPHVWHDEQEWRFIFVRAPTDHKKLPDGRTYIELPLTPPSATDPRPITAMCGGPYCDFEDDILPLQKVLYDNGYGTLFPVHVSQKHVVRPGRGPPLMRSPPS